MMWGLLVLCWCEPNKTSVKTEWMFLFWIWYWTLIYSQNILQKSNWGLRTVQHVCILVQLQNPSIVLMYKVLAWKKKIRRIFLLMFETKWVKESREFLFRRKYLFLCVKKWGVKIRYKQIWIFRGEKSGKQKIFSTRKEYLKKKWMDEILLEFFFRRIFPMCDNEWGKKSTGKTKSLENFKCFSLYTNFPSRLFSSHVWNVFVNGNISMENTFWGLSKNDSARFILVECN